LQMLFALVLRSFDRRSKENSFNTTLTTTIFCQPT
jgi:hypothetical protein